MNNGGCDTNALCKNNEGFSECTCHEGYVDKDGECVKSNNFVFELFKLVKVCVSFFRFLLWLLLQKSMLLR